MTKVCIFIFRRDLRLKDNTGLIEACKYCRESNKKGIKLLPIFIFNPEQIEPEKNEYYSRDSVQFMIESLHDLSMMIKRNGGELCFFHGNDLDVMNKEIKENMKLEIEAIFYNKDYTPFAKKRDTEIKEYCEKQKIYCGEYVDYTLFDLNEIKTDKGEPYSVFTPFYKKCIEHKDMIKKIKRIKYRDVDFHKPTNRSSKSDYMVEIGEINGYIKPNKNKDISVNGGETKGMKKVKSLKIYNDYQITRDIPKDRKGTTKMSAYLKYGCISIRYVYFKLKKLFSVNHGLIRELFWKEFYAYVTHHNERVLIGQLKNDKVNQPMQERYIDEILWDEKIPKSQLEAWKNGKTGFPMVDAGMRQMNETGWMHNRLRMITASFLVKDLHIDWKEGEKYFATQLVDYDPCSNNGGWQWCASIGADAQPYFRVFNPWIQSKTHDKECVYIKRWLPELANVKNDDIHNWFKTCDRILKEEEIEYVRPIVEHAKQKDKIKEIFESISYSITNSN